MREFPFRIRLSVNELAALRATSDYKREATLSNLASISLHTRMIPRMIRNRDSILARGTKVRERLKDREDRRRSPAELRFAAVSRVRSSD